MSSTEPTDELLRRLVRQYVDPFNVAPQDHALVLAIGTDDEDGYRAALSAALQGEMQPSEAMIEAGIAVWEQMVTQMEAREVSDSPEDMPDYDDGDVCSAIYTAMHSAALRGDEG